MSKRETQPRSVAIVGAGIVGLSTARFLQERGVEVTVFDRSVPGAGASWGNAGWITPALVSPLPEPAVLRYGLRAVLDSTSPLMIPRPFELQLIRFLTQFARNCTSKRWTTNMHALSYFAKHIVTAYEELVAAGVDAQLRRAEPLITAYRSDRAFEAMRHELETLIEAGQKVSYDVVSGTEVRDRAPVLGEQVSKAIVVHDQWFIDPGHFTDQLRHAVQSHGGRIVAQHPIFSVTGCENGVIVDNQSFDSAVISTGADLGRLAKLHGVRLPVQAGRGYSFMVTPNDPVEAPIYFPGERVACTPMRSGALRVAGMMEFQRSAAPPSNRAERLLRSSIEPLLAVRGQDSAPVWVGSRPCTPDGLPMLGRTATPGVFVAGGHGMWGVTLGPITGRVVADLVTTGEAPTGLAPFDPLR